MKDLAIIPECYIDTNLTETLLHGMEVNHQKGCGTVAKIMVKNFGDDFAVGIIDKDKNQVDYLKEFSEIINTGHLILHRHPKRNHFFIQIAPAMERFIINSVNNAGLNLADHNLPEGFDKFKKRAKTLNSKSDDVFKGLFRSLIRTNEPQVKILQNWLNYLRDNKYKVDIDELRALSEL